MSNLAIRADVSAERWALDLDLAERAGLAVPRDIRRTIATMADERILNDYDCVGVTTLRIGPAFRVQKTTAPRGNQGGTQEVDEYLLNDAGAIAVLARLRTPDAERAIRNVVATMVERLSLAADFRRTLREELDARLGAPVALPVVEPEPPPPAVEVPQLADPRPMFVVGHDHRPIVETLIEMLRASPGFCFDGFRLFLVVGQPPKQVVYAAKQINVIERLCSLARWEKVSVAGRRSPAEPPSRIVRIIIAAAREWAPRPPPDMFEQRLDAYLATFRVGTHLPLLDILRDVYQMREPSKTMFTWGVAELTKRGWEPVKGSRVGLRQEFYKSPIQR
jgi:hypothetical protein